jgi:drug/metabolite transporter (DMT)-like permease
MIFFLLVVLFNAYLSVIFKLFQRFRVDSFPAIVVNYWVCAITGSAILGYWPISAESVQYPWFPWAIGLGIGFFSVFNLIAWSTRKEGITATTIANKLSLVIPAGFALAFYAGESFHWTKGVGILCAIPAVYLSARSGTADKAERRKRAWLGPVLLFFGSGVLDTVVSYVTRTYFSGADAIEAQSVYLVHTFATAGTAGALILLFQLITGRHKWSWRDALAGVILGVPNYFSIYYLLRLLSSGLLQPSAAIPAVNIAIVVAAALCAIVFFKEKATGMRWAGLSLAILAIVLIAYTDFAHVR